MFRTEFIEVEVISHSIPGDPPKPLRFRLELGEKVRVGAVSRIVDKKTNRMNGNLIIQYRCEVLVGDKKQVVQLSYERDTMKWFIQF